MDTSQDKFGSRAQPLANAKASPPLQAKTPPQLLQDITILAQEHVEVSAPTVQVNQADAQLCKSATVIVKTVEEPADSQMLPEPAAGERHLQESVYLLGKKMLRRYQILAELGRGGMGVVYKVCDRELNRTVALKVILAEAAVKEEKKERFWREAKATALLRHPNIVTVYDIGIEDDRPFFTMELISGVSFQQYLHQGKHSLREVVEIVRKCCEAVDYAHSQGIIHRDLKPSNIMVQEQGEPKVMDFGLAKITTAHDDLSKTGDVMGTPAYMSPEQAAGSKELDARSDVFSLGATLYEALTDKPPFKGETYLNTLYQVQYKEPSPLRALNAQIPFELEAICLKSLEKEPRARYASAAEMAHDLQNFLDFKPIKAKQLTVWTHTKKFIRRHRLLFTACTMVFLAILLGGIFSFWQWRRAESQRLLAEQARRLAEISRDEVNTKLAEIYVDKAKLSLQKNYLGHALIHYWQAQQYAFLPQSSFGTMYTCHHQIPELTVLPAPSMIAAIACSPQGDCVAAALWSGDIHIWEMETGRQVRTLHGHRDAVRAVCYSPDGRYLASGGHDKSVRIWDMTTGKEVISLLGHTGMVRAVSYAPDGKQLASGSHDKSVKIWDVASGQEVLSLAGHSHCVISLQYTPDGKCLTSGSYDKTVKIWNVSNGQEVRSLSRHKSYVLAVSYTPDGRYLASGSSDRTIKIWENGEAKKVVTLQGHTDSVNALCYAPGGRHLASGSADKTVKIWDARSGSEILTLFGHTQEVVAVSYTPDGRYLLSASSDKTIKVWDLSTCKKLQQRASQAEVVNALSWSPDSKYLAGCSDKAIKIWDARSGQEVRSWPVTQAFISLTWATDSTYLAGCNGNVVTIWDAGRGVVAATLKGHSDAVTCVVYAPTGDHLASASKDGAIKIWQVSDGRAIVTSHGHFVTSLIYSPDGRYLAGSAESDIILWELSIGQTLPQLRKYRVLKGHVNTVSALAYTMDGKHLASGSWDNVIKIWEVKSGEELQILRGHEAFVISLSYAPDGDYLVSLSSDGTAKIWATTGAEVQTLAGHDASVAALIFSPNGRYLASGDNDGSARIWETGLWANADQLTERVRNYVEYAISYGLDINEALLPKGLLQRARNKREAARQGKIGYYPDGGKKYVELFANEYDNILRCGIK